MIRNLDSEQELREAWPVMRELRPHVGLEAFLAMHAEASRRDDYRVAGIRENGSWVALLGYRVLHDLVHGRHLYVDDLVVTESRRSSGLGARLLEFAESEARRLGLSGLRLCTGIENDRGKSFYERCGWKLRAVAYKKKL